MKKFLIALGIVECLFGANALAEAKSTNAPGAARQKYEIYVDNEGVMRRSDTKQEVSYYGTNYTTPFAYSYRALGYEGKDRKQAIDRDVYHISRLGLNAFRLHLWDAELADSVGNLIENEHLDLLDYMIAELEKRGIDILLTAQTNFGNGYPERNIDTGAFTYDYDKCDIHDNPQAQAAQERYLKQLVRHVNPYTGRSYAKDRAIIGIEINNEPCHSGTQQEVTAYINRMSKALRDGGFNRIILYNVTHNPDVTPAYYAANDIQGTTYQWYPTGLVANHERKGNFLPALDHYTIPWEDTMPNYGKLARAVYEFDPADVLYSHLYPAVARTFRSKGFQWITQFAYDPIDIAHYNTEYPTHYLNLAYTPAKALSMMIAAETAREIPRGADYGSYPANTSFGHTTISHDPDLSVFNNGLKYIYTNDTDLAPLSTDSLQLIAGHGSSPLISYTGSGAYFLDRTAQPGVWRLEIMPDATVISDPFSGTSLNDSKVITSTGVHNMAVRLPEFNTGMAIYNLSGEQLATAADGEFQITPGLYVLAPAGEQPRFSELLTTTVASNLRFDEYVVPEPARLPVSLYAPRQSDPDVDVCMIPEEWSFTFGYRNPSWEEPVYTLVNLSPTHDGKTVIRRRVGDKIANLPASVKPTLIKASFMTYDPEQGNASTQSLPEGTMLNVVSRSGYTYAAPLLLDENGKGEVSISQLSPAEGVIMPAPYPVTLTRDVPATTTPLNGFDDIEFIQLIIPHKAGQPTRLLLKEIWME